MLINVYFKINCERGAKKYIYCIYMYMFMQIYIFQNMSTYKLIYFNVTGLGESIRFLLSQSGIKFEDVRIEYDEWPKIKPSML